MRMPEIAPLCLTLPAALDLRKQMLVYGAGQTLQMVQALQLLKPLHQSQHSAPLRSVVVLYLVRFESPKMS